MPIPRIHALVLGLAVAAGPAASDGRATYPVVTVVRYGPELGSQDVRDRLHAQLVRQLEEARCFERVWIDAEHPPVAGDLVFDVQIEDAIDETEFAIPLATRDSPRAEPGAERQVVARMRLELRLELRVDGTVEPLRSKRLRIVAAHRPLIDEDPRLMAREEALERAARAATAWGCDATRGKWGRQVSAALEAAR